MPSTPPARVRPVEPVPRLLAFDTSTEWLAVSACGPAGNAGIVRAGGAQASTALLPLVHEVLRQAGTSLQSLDAIAFGRGPGAFTGLRTSCAVAQGLAFGLGRPVIPIDSLALVADDAVPPRAPGLEGRGPEEIPGDSVAVAMDARMDEIYGAVFERRAGRWHPRIAPALFTFDAFDAVLRREASGVACVAGSALAAFGDRMAWPARARRVPVETDRAAALLRLARAGWAAGEGVDAAQALPVYLRDKVALTTAERTARKALA